MDVLVVDDEIDVAELFAEVLTARGFHVKIAVGGRQALEVLRSTSDRPQAIVLDVMMPDVDGRELVGELRRDRVLSTIPVVAISGHSERLREMAYATFLKPVPFRLLCATLERACSGLAPR